MIDRKLFNKWKTAKFTFLLNRLNEQKEDWPDLLHGLENHREMIASELNAIDPNGQAPLILSKVNELRVESKKQKARPYEDIVLEILEQKGMNDDRELITKIAERIAYNEFMLEHVTKPIIALTPDQPVIDREHLFSKPVSKIQNKRQRKDGQTVLTRQQTALFFIYLRELKVILPTSDLSNVQLATIISELTDFTSEEIRKDLSKAIKESRPNDKKAIKALLNNIIDKINQQKVEKE